ncbi:MAG: hypothetical protein IKO49_00725 [Bacilli bacterium]|nr:hypothetical protein [Bacilli bacterium]
MGHIIVTNNIVRSFDQIREIDPYNQELINLLNKYDKKNNTNYKHILDNIVDNKSKEEYELYRMTSPVVKSIFCSYDGGSIKNVCFAEYQTDLKNFKVYVDNLNVKIYNDITKFAFKNLGMEEVIVLIESANESVINTLLNDGYIPLFDKNDNKDHLTFIKEKEDYYNTSNIICV